MPINLGATSLETELSTELSNDRVTKEHGRFGRFILAASLSLGLTASTALINNYDQITDGVDDALNIDVLPKISGVVAAGAGVVAGAAAVYVAGNILGGWKFPWDWTINGPTAEREAPKIISATDQQSYNLDAEFVITCLDQISVGVGVKGKKNNAFYESDAKIDKKLYGDFMLCGDDGKLEGSIKTSINEFDEVTSVTAIMPTLEITSPRVDMLDVRNCVDTSSTSTEKEVDELMAERQEKLDAGEEPNCDDGFGLDQEWWIAPAESSRIINLAHAGAQLGIALDADAKEIIVEEYNRYEDILEERLMDKYDVEADQVEIIRPTITPEQMLENRVENVKEDLNGRFTGYEFRDTEDGLQLVVEGPDGEEVTVVFTGDISTVGADEANVLINA